MLLHLSDPLEMRKTIWLAMRAPLATRGDGAHGFPDPGQVPRASQRSQASPFETSNITDSERSAAD